MKKYYLVFIFLFASGFLMAQFTTTITNKDGSTTTTTKTTDESLREVYSEEVRDKNGKLTSKRIYKKDLRNQWEVEHYDLDKNKHPLGVVFYFNEKGEFTKIKSHRSNNEFEAERGADSEGSIGVPDDDFNYYGRATVKSAEKRYRKIFERLDKLNEEEKKKSKDKKVSFYIGPSFLNGDNGSSRESFFGGQVYGLFNVNSNIAIGPDISLNSKKDGNQKNTQSFLLARGQYAFTGVNFDKGVTPEAHIVLGLGSESYKFTSSGNTSKSSGSGLAYGVGAGVGINLCPNIDLGISLDYISVKYENTNSANSNIRASAGIKIGI